MHHKFYLNDKFTDIEQINKLFSSGNDIKTYLLENKLRCGYHINCKAVLIPAILTKNNLVYLRSKRKDEHLETCPFHNLAKLKQKLMKNKSLNFLITDLSKRTLISKEEFNKLIVSKNQSVDIKLAELFYLLKNDPQLLFLKETSFINPQYCKEWYEKSHHIENNVVLLTGKLNRKFYSCMSAKKCNSDYDCHFKHEAKDYKVEIIEEDIMFHISVSKEIYDSIEYNTLDEIEANSNKNFKPKMYHILAQINEMKDSSSKKKKFYTKHNMKFNHVVKNKKFVELIKY